MIDNEEKPNFKNCVLKAQEVLIQCNKIETFPFSLYLMIMEISDIQMQPYSKYKDKSLPPEKLFGSKEGSIFESEGYYIILYNDDLPMAPLRFTVAHEFGHYFLEHDIEKIITYLKSKNPKHSALYSKYEVEANFFVAELLMPEVIINEFKKRGIKITEEFLVKTFDVSKAAAEKRINTLQKINEWKSSYSSYLEYPQKNCDKTVNYNDCILKKFKPFIDKVAPKKSYFSYEEENKKQQERELWVAEGY